VVVLAPVLGTSWVWVVVVVGPDNMYGTAVLSLVKFKIGLIQPEAPKGPQDPIYTVKPANRNRNYKQLFCISK